MAKNAATVNMPNEGGNPVAKARARPMSSARTAPIAMRSALRMAELRSRQTINRPRGSDASGRRRNEAALFLPSGMIALSSRRPRASGMGKVIGSVFERFVRSMARQLRNALGEEESPSPAPSGCSRPSCFPPAPRAANADSARRPKPGPLPLCLLSRGNREAASPRPRRRC